MNHEIIMIKICICIFVYEGDKMKKYDSFKKRWRNM